MAGHVLTLNAGSSSLKFGLFELAEAPIAVATGMVERQDGIASIELKSALGETLLSEALSSDAAHSRDGMYEAVLRALQTHYPERAVAAVGHRVVHGG
ncbi:MAG: acetate kinase, partial [Pseudomonadota bacterium]